MGQTQNTMTIQEAIEILDTHKRWKEYSRPPVHAEVCEAIDVVTAYIQNENTLELCSGVLNHLSSKLSGDISPEPSLNRLAVLASDIIKQIKQ